MTTLTSLTEIRQNHASDDSEDKMMPLTIHEKFEFLALTAISLGVLVTIIWTILG